MCVSQPWTYPSCLALRALCRRRSSSSSLNFLSSIHLCGTQVSDMASEVAWMLTALLVLATVCIGVFKGIVGDGVQFDRRPREFILARLARYGDPFTISLLGKTYTLLNSPETVKYVLSTAHESFIAAYPVQYTRLLHPEKFLGDKMSHVRRSVLSATSGDGLQKRVPFISSLAEKTIKSWENQAVVNFVEESHKFAFNVGMHVIWRNVEPGSEVMEQMRNEIVLVREGVVALPINFPGFSFHKAMKAKQALFSRIQSEISRRRKAGIQQDDVLNTLMSIGDVEFPDYEICCVMVIVMFAASVTTSALIPWILKYLDDFPEVRQRVQEEQDCLRQTMIEDKSLTWFKAKRNMPYTLQFIYEILRIEFFAVFPRQANKDVDYNGLVFRKGSNVWPSGTSIHFDPKHHPNPQEFDPSRFIEGKFNPNTFLPFGQGAHYCLGSEVALTETMFLIHHLLTNYSWERCGPEKGVIQHPVRTLVAYPIRLVKRCMT